MGFCVKKNCDLGKFQKCLEKFSLVHMVKLTKRHNKSKIALFEGGMFFSLHESEGN